MYNVHTVLYKMHNAAGFIVYCLIMKSLKEYKYDKDSKYITPKKQDVFSSSSLQHLQAADPYQVTTSIHTFNLNQVKRKRERKMKKGIQRERDRQTTVKGQTDRQET